jgi:hypothetical protein
MIADEQAENFARWLAETAEGNIAAGVKPDPKGAADLYLKAIEYHIPKLARVESSVDMNANVTYTIATGVPDARG